MKHLLILIALALITSCSTLKKTAPREDLVDPIGNSLELPPNYKLPNLLKPKSNLK